jgi:hypothetical protein
MTRMPIIRPDRTGRSRRERALRDRDVGGGWLAMTVAELALQHDVELDGPPELLAELRRLTDRLTSLTVAIG